MTLGEYLKELRKEKSISQRELAIEAGISNAEISRIETGERQKPSPDVLKQIAPILGVSYEQLMEKAGYLNERVIQMAEAKDGLEKFYSIVGPKLMLERWLVNPRPERFALGDIVASQDNIEWHIDFTYNKIREGDDKYFREAMHARQMTYLRYGRLACYDKSPISKYTLVTNNNKLFDELIKFNPVNLSTKISIMLLDLDKLKIVSEYEFDN